MKYYRMTDHWKKFGPPVYISVAGYLGLTGKNKTGSKPQPGNPFGKTGETGDLEDLANFLSGTGGVLNG